MSLTFVRHLHSTPHAGPACVRSMRGAAKDRLRANAPVETFAPRRPGPARASHLVWRLHHAVPKTAPALLNEKKLRKDGRSLVQFRPYCARLHGPSQSNRRSYEDRRRLAGFGFVAHPFIRIVGGIYWSLRLCLYRGRPHQGHRRSVRYLLCQSQASSSITWKQSIPSFSCSQLAWRFHSRHLRSSISFSIQIRPAP